VKADKSSRTVRPGDVVTVALGDDVRILRVVSEGVRRGPAPEAQLLYDDLTPPPTPPTPEAAPPARREQGAGRPTKRERRRMDVFLKNG
jgi:ribosome-associated heat shock protein Hsp15